jgi:hypothetical protein
MSVLSKRDREVLKKGIKGEKLDDRDYVTRSKLRKKIPGILTDIALLAKAMSKGVI